MSALALAKGFGVGASLIIAIGSQNAFVLTNAIRGKHVIPVAALCIVIDALLIVAGIWGLGKLIQQSPMILTIATWGGALFLFIYGILAFRRAFSPQSLQTNQSADLSLKAALLTAAALSLLNPHVYLDTVILLGSIGGQLPKPEPFWFGVGACCASLAWFSVLSWGGRRLAPWFANPKSWQYLDILVGATMWLIAFSLLRGA